MLGFLVLAQLDSMQMIPVRARGRDIGISVAEIGQYRCRSRLNSGHRVSLDTSYMTRYQESKMGRLCCNYYDIKERNLTYLPMLVG